MIVTIHQPAFFPWWPFFLKMQSADIFVLLRHCQFEKNGFQNRFQYGGNWMTMSTEKGLDPIIQKKYINPQEDWTKIKKKVGREILSKFDEDISTSLWETNYNIIKRVCKIMNIQTKIVLDDPTSLKSTERLVDICKNLSATKYVSGPSGQSYLDTAQFEKAGIEVVYHDVESIEKVHTIDKIEKQANVTQAAMGLL